MIEVRFIKNFQHKLGSLHTRIYSNLKTINGAIKRIDNDQCKPDFDFVEIYQYQEALRFDEEQIKKSLKKVLPAKFFIN